VHVVLNWLAQGVILALAVALGLRVIPRSRTPVRYSFLWTAYLSLLALPAVGPLLMLMRESGPIGVDQSAAIPLVNVPVVWWSSSTVMIVLWMIWFGMQALALGRDVAAAHKANRRAEACPRDLLARLPHWSRVSAAGRMAPVVLSKSVRAAGVVGCGTPAIAIAPRLVDQLSAGDLDRVLVHEWAHVQRRDDLAHVVQRLVRALVGWHPAAWWLERQLDFEREMACDEIVVRVTGSAKAYAQCLVAIAALELRAKPAVPVFAAMSRSRLHHRVDRILAAPRALVRRSRALALAGAVFVVACLWVVGNVQLAASATASPFVTTTEPTRAKVVAVSTPSRRASRELIAPIARSARPETRPVDVRAEPAAPTSGAPEHAATTNGSEGPALISTAPLPLASERIEHAVVAASAVALQDARGDPPAGWSRAADAGVAIGRASQAAGVATAGFFRRFGKKVADSF